MKHENEFRAFLCKKPMTDDSRRWYAIYYLEAVEWGIGEQITPELLRANTDDDILAKVRKKDLRKKPGRKPSPKYLKNMRAALRRYQEMCEKHNL